MPLETDISVPQNDAMSPVALKIVILAGFNYTAASRPVDQLAQTSDSMSMCSLFVYGPSFLDFHFAAMLVGTLRTWHSFSAGIRENQAKNQFTYSSGEAHRDLQPHVADDPLLPCCSGQ